MGNANGGAGPEELQDGTEAVGYRVLGVQAGSPAASAGLVSFFDFIIAANGIRFEVRPDYMHCSEARTSFYCESCTFRRAGDTIWWRRMGCQLFKEDGSRSALAGGR
jgi:hypothetical protein